MDFPASLIGMMQEGLAKQGRLPATGLVRVPDPLVAIPISGGAGLSSPGSSPPLKFSESGHVIALYGQERTGTQAKFASTEIQLLINGQSSLFTSGEAGPAFFPMLGLFGPSVHWFPMMVPVAKGDLWQVNYLNFDPAAVAMPTVGCAFLSHTKLDRMAAELRARGH
jgi:hypothetical protein